MDMVWKGIAGGLVTSAIARLSRRGNTLPGILPLFPTFALIALLIVGAKHDTSGFRQACIAGAKTIPAYLAGGVLVRGRPRRLPPCSAGRAGRLVCRGARHFARAALDLTTISIG